MDEEGRTNDSSPSGPPPDWFNARTATKREEAKEQPKPATIDQPLPTFGQHTTPIDADIADEMARHPPPTDSSNLMRPAAPVFIPRPSPTAATRTFDIFAAERHAPEQHPPKTAAKPPLPDITDIKIQKDIERGPFALPKSMLKKAPEQEAKASTTPKPQPVSKQEPARKPAPPLSTQKPRTLGAVKGIPDQKRSVTASPQQPSLSQLEDLPIEKESPYFADMDVDSMDALSASLSDHNERVPEGTAPVIGDMPCPRCEKHNDPEANFCCRCGMKLGRDGALLPKLNEMLVTQHDEDIEEEVKHEARRFPIFRFGPDGAFICIKTTVNRRGRVVSDKVFKSSLSAHPEIKERLLHKHRLIGEGDEGAMASYLKSLPGPLSTVVSLALEAEDEATMTAAISKYLQEMTCLPQLPATHKQDPSLLPLLLTNQSPQFCEQSTRSGSNWELALIASHYTGNWDKVLEAYSETVLKDNFPLRTLMTIYADQELTPDTDSDLIDNWHHILSVLISYKRANRIYSLGKALQPLSIEASLVCFIACNRLDEPLCLPNASIMVNIAKAWSSICSRLNQPSCFAPFLDTYQLRHAEQLTSLGLIEGAKGVFEGISRSKVEKKAYNALRSKLAKPGTSAMVDTAVEVDDLDLEFTSRGGTESIAASVTAVTEIRRTPGRGSIAESPSHLVIPDDRFEQAISDMEEEVQRQKEALQSPRPPPPPLVPTAAMMTRPLPACPSPSQASISAQPRPPLQHAPPSEFAQPKPLPQKQLTRATDFTPPKPPPRRNSFDSDDLGLGNKALLRRPSSPTPSVASDRGSYSPHDKQRSSSPSSILSRVSRLFRLGKSTPNLAEDASKRAAPQVEQPKAMRANLGERNTFYFDDKLGRWVDEGGDKGEIAGIPPPPPSSAPATSFPQYGAGSSAHRMPAVNAFETAGPSAHEKTSLPSPRPVIPLPSMRPPLPTTPTIMPTNIAGRETRPATEASSFTPWMPEPSPPVKLQPPLPSSSSTRSPASTPPMRPPVPMPLHGAKMDKKELHSFDDSMA